MSLNNADFEYITKLVRDRSAIVLEAGKEYLVESRLLPIVRSEGCTSFADLVVRLRSPSANGLLKRVVEAMTTNETSFFRDLHPFEVLKKTLLPELAAKRESERRLNLWCAASSSGQEPYSIALLLREHFPLLANWTVRFMATDLSVEMVERARAGRYSQLEVNRGMPAPLLVKYFQRHGVEWQVKEELRKTVEFRQMNLLDAWAALPEMDVIFMRNVLIYFDVPTKKAILAKVRRLLRPDGYLFLGAAETTLNLDDGFERVQFDKAGCYRLRNR
ncbi:MAG: protein-glutamate O-methyltransferase CheR [Candidatus Binatia bacterium]